MQSVRGVVIALAVSTFSVQFVSAEMEHRMGGLPGMPAHMLKPGAELDHHEKHHPADGMEAPTMSPFGQPGQVSIATRTVRIDVYDEARFVPDSLNVAAGETVQIEVHNAGIRPHELRIGDPRYQQEHAKMLKSMPGWEHSSSNSIVVAPGETETIVWQFGNGSVVELACHLDGNYQAGMVTKVAVGMTR